MNILEALKAQSEAAGETYVELNADGPTVVPGGDDLLLSEYSRLGPDLQITLPTGDTVVVVDYFSGGGVPPTLQTEGGAVVHGDLVSQLAGPMVPDTQIAQTGTSDALGEAAGIVDNMKGEVVAIRGGVEVQLGAGDSIYEGDVLVTGADGAVGIIFADDSTMSMGGGARISIDEMVYDANAGSGSQLFDVVQGAFVFASGQIGKDDPENVQVRTPVATIGIRGTKYAINVDQELGEATVTLFEGAVVVENGAGQALLNSIGQSTVVTSAFTAPGDVFVMDPDTQTSTYGDAIDYHPNQPQLREDDDGGGEDGSDSSDLGADELEKLAEELDDLDTAAGPSGAIAGFTQSALFLRLLNGVLDGGDFTSGELGDDGFSVGNSLLPIEPIRSNETILNNSTPSDGTYRIGSDAFSSGSYTYTFDASSPFVSVTGSSGFDLFNINAQSAGISDWTVGQSGGRVVIQAGSYGAGNFDVTSTIDVDDVEELQIDLGSDNNSITIGDLSSTDIAESTVILNTGAGNDTIDGSEANKRFVIDGGTGDDTLIGGTSSDDLLGGAGNDTLVGGTGDDGGASNDLLIGGAGDDTLVVTLEGGAVDANPPSTEDAILNFGDSAVSAARAYDVVIGGEGNDTVVLNIPEAQLTNPEFAQELVDLKNHIESGNTGADRYFPALGLQISGVENVVFQGAAADLSITPALTVGNGVEDGEATVSLTLEGALETPLLDIDVTISGVPEGATLVVGGQEFAGGSAIVLDLSELGLTHAQLADMVLKFAPDSDADVSLTVSVSAEAILTGDKAATELSGTAVVDGVADAPVVSVSDAVGSEDGAISLSISVAQGDADGSETVTVAIQGLPEGAVLLDAQGNELDPSEIPESALNGLQIVPPANFSGEIPLSVVATSSEGTTTASSTATGFTVNVAAVADAADLVTAPAEGLEDGAIQLTIAASATDAGETVTLSIAGLPEGAKLVDGDGNVLDATNISGDQIGDIHLVPPQDFSGEIVLSVTATTQDGDSTQTSDPAPLTVTVGGVADAPIVQVGDGAGDEDGLIGLSISVAQGDIDGSETVSVAIQGLPEGAKLFDAAGNELEPGNISPDVLSGLKLLPPLNFTGTMALSVVATSAEGNTTATSEPAGFTVNVSGVADGAELVLAPASGLEDGAIPLDIDVNLADASATETVTLSISGLPEGAKLVDGNGVEIDADSISLDQLGSINLVPPQDFSGEIALTVTATTQDGESQAVTSGSLTVSVSGVADAPIVQVGNGAGDEDGLIDLSISVAQGDVDGSETVSVAIQGLPEGAKLFDASGNELNPGNISPSALFGLKLLPPLNFAGTLALSVVATSAEGETTATSEPADFTVTVSGVADTVEIIAGPAAGAEDGAIPLSISTKLTDGDETVTVSIGGLPEGARLLDGDGNEVDPVGITSDLLPGLSLVPPQDFSGEITLSVTATSQDGDSTADSTGSLTVSVSGVADAPIVQVGNGAGDEDSQIGLSISVAQGDADGSETVTVALEGLPVGAILTDAEGTLLDPGAIPVGSLSGLILTPPLNFNGTLTLTVVATSAEGGTTATSSQSFTVDVAAVADAADLELNDVVDIEGNAVSLNIGAVLPDDGESLTIAISGLPEGATIVDALGTVLNPDAIPGDALDGLKMVLPAGFSGDIALEVTATTADGDSTAVSTGTLNVSISGVADDPELIVSGSVGSEDNAIGLSIEAFSTDADGSEELTVSIDGLPEGAVLLDALGNALDPAAIAPEVLSGLQLVPPANFSGTITLTVTATSSEDGTSAVKTGTLSVEVTPVADAADLEIGDTVGLEGAVVDLNIAANLNDDETLTVSIEGLPDGAVLIDADNNPVDPSNVPGALVGGLKMVVPEDFSGSVSLSITATTQDGDSTATTTGTMTIAISGVADDPDLVLTGTTGSEDGAIALSISAGLTDADGETLSVQIDGLPDGARLIDAEGNDVDPADVPPALLSGLQVVPPVNFSGTLNLTVTATSSEDGTSAVKSGSLSVDVTGVADAPELDLSNASGDEGLPLALNISAALADTDGSETLSIQIGGLPQGFALTDGTNYYSGDPVSIPPAALSALTLLPLAGFAGTLSLTVTATATEADGDTNSVTETLGINLADVALTPVLSVLNAVGDEDSTIPLNISAAAHDGDSLTVTVTGLPSGASLVNDAGETFTGDEISLTAEQLAGLKVQPAANSDQDFTLTVTATSTDGDDSASISSSLTVTVDGVADTPTLSVSPVTGIEDIPIALNIDAALADIDGSESLTIEVDGLGDGFSLKAADGTIYSGDPAVIPGDALEGLVLLSPLNFAGGLSLTIRAIATEGGSGDTALVERNLSVSITPELDLPTITALTASGNEDESIPLDIAIGNIDPNETITVSIENLPAGATLTNSAGESFTGGTVTLTVEQLEGLAVIPPQDSGADFDLTIRVTTAQGEESASTSQSLGVVVRAKADDPTLIVGDMHVVLGRAEATTETGTSGDDTLIGGAGGDTLIGGDGNDHLIGDGGNLSAIVSLNLEAYSNDIDGSEVVTVTIDGLPAGVQLLQAGEVLVTGEAATLPADMLNSITLLVPPGTANFTLQITARTTDFDPDGGGDSATHTASIAVSVEDGSGLGSNDVLIGGAGNDLLEGGSGADTLIAGTGADTLLGGAGNDVLQVVRGSDGDDVIDGGSGTDTLTLTVTEWDLLDVGIVTDLQELVAFVASGAAATGSMVFESLGLEVKNIEGLNILDTNGDPIDIFDIVFPDPGTGITYSGDSDDNVATGTDYDDTMYGSHGNDTLYGEGGNDKLYGENGQDTLYGGDGDDLLDGGHENDVLDGGAGNDTIYGGNGNDTIDAGSGDDHVEGGHGDDVIRMGTGSGTVDAGTGNDLTVVTIDADETDRALSLDGGHGDDTLRIELSADHPDLNSVMSDIAAATAAAHANSSGQHSIGSLGITFKNFEDVEIYVDGTQVTIAPEIDEPADLNIDSAAVSAGAEILDGISLSDADGSQLMQATVRISGGYQSGDILTVDESVLSGLGLNIASATATADGYVLTISGDATLSEYETALEAVRLSSNDTVPEPGTRTISVQVTDDDGNTSDTAEVSVSVTMADAPELADTGDGDSVAFLSEASASGATVTGIADVPNTVTETLAVVVGKNGYTGTGQFEVIVNGESMGTFTTTVRATGYGAEWQTIEIGEMTLPLGEAVDIQVKAVSSSSNVLLKSITYGDAAIEAESGDITSISSIIDEVTSGLGSGQSWSDILSNLADDWVNLFSDSYIMLDPTGTAASYALTPGEDLNPLDGWKVTEDGTVRDIQNGDLGDRYDEIDMGDGTDWAVAAAGTEDDLTVDLSGSVWRGTENALGGRGNDTLIGNEDANLLAGGDGDDVLIANGDNDLLIGGAGDDELHYDIADLQAAGNAQQGNGFGTVDQAISDAYEANDLDGAAALESLRAGVNGGSGMDTLKLTGGNGSLSSLSGDALANAVKNVEILDVTGVDGPVDMSLSVDDLIEMTDDRDELKILKDGEDTVKVGDQEYGAGEHTVNVGGVDFKLTIEDVDTPPDV